MNKEQSFIKDTYSCGNSEMATDVTIDPSSVQVVRPGWSKHNDRRLSNFFHAVTARFKHKDMDMPVVQPFSLEQYLGTWYEVARLPVPFEHKICNVKTTIEKNENGTLSVLNRGRKSKITGKKKYVTGKAIVPDMSEPAKMEVHFPNMPLPDQYWILDVSTDYRFALVGEPRKRYLWVLARSIEDKPMVDIWLRHSLEYAKQLGYDVTKIVMTRHEKFENVLSNSTSYSSP